MGSIITTRISIAGAILGPIGLVLNNGIHPKLEFNVIRNGLIKGSITNTAHNPSTTDGKAAKSSTIIPIILRIDLGIMFSVINIAVPTPSGTAIKIDPIDVIMVP